MVDKLVLLYVGEESLNNASAGGILISPTGFKLGDSALYPTSTQFSDIVGNELCSGSIHHVEVLSSRTARFVLTVDTSTFTGSIVAKELVIFLEQNIALGRAVFASPYTLAAGESVRISVVLATSRADLTTINVTPGEYDSIPQTPNVYRLPNPNSSDFNVISVLDGCTNLDSTKTPALAMRYGTGSVYWGFSNHTKVYQGSPLSATSSTFKLPSNLTFNANEVVLVHVISGSGVGLSRRYKYSSGVFTDVDSQTLPNPTGNVLCIWRNNSQIVASSDGSASSTVPDTTNIPSGWVLTVNDSNTASWQPASAAARTINTLYTAPSKLAVNAIAYTGDDSNQRFSTGDLVPDNANFVYAALGMATQHRTAFALSGSEIEFAEAIPSTVDIDLRVFTKNPSTGTRIGIDVYTFTGDGSTTTFQIGVVESSAHVFAFINSALVPPSNYSIDTNNKLRFNTPPDAGTEIEIRALVYVSDTGYSTRIVSQVYKISADTNYLQLPIAPQDKSLVFVSQSGAHVHTSYYSIVDNYVVFTSSLEQDLEVEVFIFDNVLAQGTQENGLNGMVVDGFLSYRDIVLLRHGALPIVLPLPQPNLIEGDNCTLTQEGDSTMISCTVPETSLNISKYSVSKTEKNSSNAIITQRLELGTSSVIVQIICDFATRLGPGFISSEGNENIEFVVGIRSSSSTEPDFGRNIRGTGVAGITTNATSKQAMGYGNASMTQTFEIDPANHTAGYVELVAKMRVNNANTALFSSRLDINMNVLVIPK